MVLLTVQTTSIQVLMFTIYFQIYILNHVSVTYTQSLASRISVSFSQKLQFRSTYFRQFYILVVQ